MERGKEKVLLGENLAAVRLSNEWKGVVIVIPASAVIHIDRGGPPSGPMAKVEWNGATYSVFWEDLLKRVDSANPHHVDNPGIVPIARTKN